MKRLASEIMCWRHATCFRLWDSNIQNMFSICAFGAQTHFCIASDGAYSNDKLCAHLYGIRLAGVLFDHVHCALHSNQLIEVHLMATWPKLLSSLYSFTKFLRTSGYFLKLTGLLKQYVLEHLEVRRGYPTDDMELFAKEIFGYVMAHRKRFVKLQDRIRHHWQSA